MYNQVYKSLDSSFGGVKLLGGRVTCGSVHQAVRYVQEEGCQRLTDDDDLDQLNSS